MPLLEGMIEAEGQTEISAKRQKENTKKSNTSSCIH